MHPSQYQNTSGDHWPWKTILIVADFRTTLFFSAVDHFTCQYLSFCRQSAVAIMYRNRKEISSAEVGVSSLPEGKTIRVMVMSSDRHLISATSIRGRNTRYSVINGRLPINIDMELSERELICHSQWISVTICCLMRYCHVPVSSSGKIRFFRIQQEHLISSHLYYLFRPGSLVLLVVNNGMVLPKTLWCQN